MAAESMARERATFQNHKNILLSESEGKFVLIHGDQVVGVWDSYDKALQAGYDQFDLAPFMVKKIERVERTNRLGWAISCRSSRGTEAP